MVILLLTVLTSISSKINYIYYKNILIIQSSKENKMKDLLKNTLILLKKRKKYLIVLKF